SASVDAQSCCWPVTLGQRLESCHACSLRDAANVVKARLSSTPIGVYECPTWIARLIVVHDQVLRTEYIFSLVAINGFRMKGRRLLWHQGFSRARILPKKVQRIELYGIVRAYFA